MIAQPVKTNKQTNKNKKTEPASGVYPTTTWQNKPTASSHAGGTDIGFSPLQKENNPCIFDSSSQFPEYFLYTVSFDP